MENSSELTQREVDRRLRPRAIILSRGLRQISTLAALLNDYSLCFAAPRNWDSSDAVIAWGMRPSAAAAEIYAKKRNIRLLHVEDGLVRSVGLGVEDPPLSLMVDDLGLYFDASRPTRLENEISVPVDVGHVARSRELIRIWCEQRVSKYNFQRHAQLIDDREYVLVVDQTFGDASVSAGFADTLSFHRMLSSAIKENPNCEIWVKVHPEVVAGRKRGYFDLTTIANIPFVRVVSDDEHPAGLIRSAKAVYVVTSQIGFEALLWGKNVRVFGMPFYAGWGLTHDDLLPPERRAVICLDQLVYGVFVRYMRCVHPETKLRCTPEALIDWIGLQLKQRGRFPKNMQALSFSKWKRQFIKEFFYGTEIDFIASSKKISPFQTLIVWGSKGVPSFGLGHAVEAIQPIRVEDGFLRSVGLGASLIRPLSWIQDPVGIYYDASRPSYLEQILSTCSFSASLLERAASFRHKLIDQKVTKYNLNDATRWSRPHLSSRVLLVPGQVESDASIAFGALSVRTNLDLLIKVRTANPDALVIYKPHPDVFAKLRDEGKDEGLALHWCDEVVGNVPINLLLDEVDEVHTMTSLAGFEGLLRGKTVVTYGQPFYAGWGLTADMDLSESVAARRTRRLTLDELVAAALLLYPTYLSRVTRRFTTPERALHELVLWRQEKPTLPIVRTLLSRLFRKK